MRKTVKQLSKEEIIDFCSQYDFFEVQTFTGGIKKGKLSVFCNDICVLEELQRFANTVIKLNVRVGDE